jgi:hypothetical protein
MDQKGVIVNLLIDGNDFLLINLPSLITSKEVYLHHPSSDTQY